MAGSRMTAAVLDVGCFSAHLVVVERKLTRLVLSHKVRLQLDRAIDGAGRTGVNLRFLSGRREARLLYLAARHWLRPAGPLTVLDVGGGTVEIAFGAEERPDFACSLPIGARILTRAGLTDGRHLEAMRAQVTERIGDALPAGIRDGLARAPGVGCSKVYQQLATLTGARRLDAADLSAWIDHLAAMRPQDRAALPGISRHRARQALAGAVVAEALMMTIIRTWAGWESHPVGPEELAEERRRMATPPNQLDHYVVRFTTTPFGRMRSSVLGGTAVVTVKRRQPADRAGTRFDARRLFSPGAQQRSIGVPWSPSVEVRRVAAAHDASNAHADRSSR
jgi:exopolyphosphatase/guanosine-5'-triphosphate,3'-diphosphate pyrophosphatase